MKKSIIFSFISIATVAIGFATSHFFQDDQLEKERSVIPGSPKTESLPNTTNTIQNTNQLNLRFFDEATGIAVVPERIEISKNNSNEASTIVFRKQISDNGRVSVNMPNGLYDIIVKAIGYNPMSTSLQLDDQALDVNFRLVRINPVRELETGYIQSLHRPDAMVIVGFVVDDVTGEPLENVEIYSVDEKVRTSSNSSGFFQLILPLAESEDLLDDRGTLVFEKKNYSTEIRQNFDMYPMGDIGFKIWMKMGTGINRTDIIQHRQADRMILN